MRNTNIQYLQSAPATVSIRNNEASLALLDGMPVFFDNNNVSSVNLGADVKSHSGALGSSPGSMLVGIAKTNKGSVGIIAGEVGEAVCYGFTDSVVVRRTRAATTDSWASIASIGAGDLLIPETANNYLTWSATCAIGANQAGIYAGESAAALVATGSTATSLSAFSTVTAQTLRMKVLVRLM